MILELFCWIVHKFRHNYSERGVCVHCGRIDFRRLKSYLDRTYIESLTMALRTYLDTKHEIENNRRKK